MKKAILIVIGCMGIAILSCKKEDNGKPISGAEIIGNTTWEIDTIGIDANNNGSIDTEIPGGFDECELDNKFTFNDDSTGVLDEGLLKCDDSDDQQVSFEWTLKDDDKIINIDGDLPAQFTGDAKIITLTDHSFILSKEVFAPIHTYVIISLKK